MSHQEFVQLYEKPGIPVVVTGSQDAWQAQKLWNKGELDQRFGNHKFKVLFHGYQPGSMHNNELNGMCEFSVCS